MANELHLAILSFMAYLLYIIPIGFGNCLGVVSRPIHECVFVADQQHRQNKFNFQLRNFHARAWVAT